ncbi:Serine/threonine-protein kinase [Rhynchospora pubera]|uniref:Receptor-like serine/threonine-protein kinase n=1 Tax=Rhynchospora pubera TaxID=906938 RepID=A0AAV8CG08_9POAL|nr:Serine/threonine-protein kinase [Rhynchospora pubera]KAJ4817625.1 Serine/threonine-protein kinase [Rhynchospora pubera]
MPLLFLILLLLFHFHGASAEAPVYTEYMYPTISLSELLYTKSDGTFLQSRNGNFQGLVYKPGTQQTRYYLSILHVPTQTAIWTANRNNPMPDRESRVNLTPLGLTVGYSNGDVLWSTPTLKSNVSALRLLDTGNLMLLDVENNTLWQSFDYPTDTLVTNQSLLEGSYLSSSVASDSDLSQGDYRLDVTPADAVLSWMGSSYWRFSNDISSVKNQDFPVAAMATNDSGLYLLASNGRAVFQILMPTAPFHIVQLGSDGRLKVNSYVAVNSSTSLSNAFVAPRGGCDLPLTCGPLGLCSLSASNSSSCSCPPQFVSSVQSSGCTPARGLLKQPNASCTTLQISYMFVGSGITYFANKYRNPVTSGKNISDCQNLCSSNCSCAGYFFDIPSQSCFLSQQPFGSLTNASTSESANSLAYVKIQGSNISSNSSSKNLVAILSPSIIAFLLVLVVGWSSIICWRNKQNKKLINIKSSSSKDKLHSSNSRAISDSDYLFSESGDDIDEILIPGLPQRFTFQQVEEITGNFQTKIGSGGFGSVYKGDLPDNSEVAVKKIEGAGMQGRKEFCTEIAVIGNIHHVNLVRLRGYCAQSSHRLLIYEYMNRGSLDRSLFRMTEKLLSWTQRMNVAIGAARGIAYLHSGCRPKILHCDIKPENILLDDEGHVKIADFGLAKLLTPEQSGLFTTMRGTRGYLAPEWIMNAAISDRSDVYSFGMVLLELVRGRKNRGEPASVDGQSKWSTATGGSSVMGGEYFPCFALEMHLKKCYEELADPRLDGNVVISEIERMVKTALCCLHEEPALRPNMTSVVAMLEGTMEVWEPRVESLGSLRMYGRRKGSSSSNGTIDIEDELKMSKNIGGSNVTSNTTSGWPSFMSANDLSGPR